MPIAMNAFVCLIIILLLANVIVTRLYIEDITQCPQYKTKVYFKNLGVTADGIENLDLNFTFVKPLDNNDLVVITLFANKEGNWTKLFTIPQKLGVCKVLETFLGTIWFDVERLSGKNPRTCPIQGLYRVSNYQFDGRQVRIPLPKGYLKLACVVVKKKTGKFVDCFDFIVKQP